EEKNRDASRRSPFAREGVMSKLIQFLKDLRVGPRITAAFAIMIALLLTIATTGFFTLSRIASEVDHALKLNAPMAEHAARTRTDAADLRRYEKDIFLNISDPAKVVEYQKKWMVVREEMIMDLGEIEKNADTADEKRDLATMRQQFAAYDAGMQQVIE